MQRRAILWSLLVLLGTGAGCVAESDEPAEEAHDETVEPAPPPVPPVTEPAPSAPVANKAAFLVWGVDPKGGEHTWSVDETGEDVEEIDGIAIATREGIARWTVEEASAPRPSCRELLSHHGEPAPEWAPSAPGVASTIEGRFESAGRPNEVAVARESEEGYEIRQEAYVLGSIGPHVFIRETSYINACGAHGMLGASFKIWNLETHAAEKLDELVGPTAAIAEARAAFLADNADNPLWGDGKLDGELEITRTLIAPTWVDGRLLIAEQLTTGACWACSDGAWSGYSRSTRLPLRTTPAALATWSQTPDAVTKMTARHSDLQMRGWSSLTDDAR